MFMDIVEFTEENIEQYLDDCLEAQKFLIKPGEPVEAEQFRLTAASEHTYFIGVLDEGRVLGLGVVNKIVHPVRTNSYIDNIVVHEDARGKGYFKVIMNELERKSKEWGCTKVSLTCSREAVQGMYTKRGYKEKDTKYYTLDI